MTAALDGGLARRAGPAAVEVDARRPSTCSRARSATGPGGPSCSPAGRAGAGRRRLYQHDLPEPGRGGRRSTCSSPITENQTGGDGIHSPEVCLPAGGWEIFASRRARSRCPAPRRHLPAQPGGDPEGARQAARLLLVRGRRPALDQRHAAEVPRRGRQPDPRPDRRRRWCASITPIGADGEAAADARLTRFLEASVDRLRRNLPE